MTRRKKKIEVHEFANTGDALSDTSEEAANLAVRSDLLTQISQIIKKSGWTQVEAAKRCRITQPRMSNLLRGRIDRFSLDALVNIATALGRKVQLKLKAA